MPLFEVAILQQPTKKEAEDGHQEKLLFGPQAVVARDALNKYFGLRINQYAHASSTFTRTPPLFELPLPGLHVLRFRLFPAVLFPLSHSC